MQGSMVRCAVMPRRVAQRASRPLYKPLQDQHSALFSAPPKPGERYLTQTPVFPSSVMSNFFPGALALSFALFAGCWTNPSGRREGRDTERRTSVAPRAS